MNPQLCYSAPLAKSRRALLKKLRTSAIGEIEGGGRSQRTPELVMIICPDPIRADPKMTIACETVLACLRFIHRFPLKRFCYSSLLGLMEPPSFCRHLWREAQGPNRPVAPGFLGVCASCS